MEPMDITHDFASARIEDRRSSSSSMCYSETSERSTAESCSQMLYGLSSPEASEELKSPTEPMNHATIPSWSPQDEHFAQLFNYWEKLPLVKTANWREKLGVLRSLEQVIVPFEQAINHSDEEFARWRSLHQAAMDNGLSPVPGWPQLHDPSRGWLNNKWTERYRYLVNTREKLIAWRFHSLQVGSFSRGPRVSRPDRVSLRKGQVSLGVSHQPLPEHWARPVDALLAAEAERQGIAAEWVTANFWTRPPSSDEEEGGGGGGEEPALADMSSPSELSSPPFVTRAMEYSQAWDRCETPTPTKGGKKVHPEVIKIESDSD